MFQGLRTNSLFYILSKGEKPTLQVGQVTNVSNPQPKFGQPGVPNMMFNPNADTTVDVSVKVGDTVHQFNQLPSNQSVSFDAKTNTVVSDNREAMIAEVEAMVATSRHALESVPYHQSVVNACDGIMLMLNPQIAKEREQERKITELETKMGGIENALNQIVGMLSDKEHNKPTKKSKEE